MGVLKYFKRFFGFSIIPPETDFKERLKYFQTLVNNCEAVVGCINTPGWKVIEQVVVDSIEGWKEELTQTTKPEEVLRLQVSIQIFRDWLSVIDQVDESMKQAKEELTLTKEGE